MENNLNADEKRANAVSKLIIIESYLARMTASLEVLASDLRSMTTKLGAVKDEFKAIASSTTENTEN